MMARLNDSMELSETPAELPGQSAEIRPSRPSNRYTPFPRPAARIHGVHQQQQNAHQNLVVRHELDATSSVWKPRAHEADQNSNSHDIPVQQAAFQNSGRPSLFERIRIALHKSAESSPPNKEDHEEPSESSGREQGQPNTSRFRTVFQSLKQRTSKLQFWRRGAKVSMPSQDLELSPDLRPTRSHEMRPPSPIPSLSPVSTMRYEMLEEGAVGFGVRPWSRPASRTNYLRAQTPQSSWIGKQKARATRASSQLRYDTSSPRPSSRQGRRASRAMLSKSTTSTETRPANAGPKRMSIGTMLASQMEEYEELRRSHNWEAVTEDDSEATVLSSTPMPSSTPLPSSTPPSSPPDRVIWFGPRSKGREQVPEESPSSVSELEASDRPSSSVRSSFSSMHSSAQRLRPRPRPKTIAVDRRSRMASLLSQEALTHYNIETQEFADKTSTDIGQTYRKEARSSRASFTPARKQLGALFKELESARRDARRIEAAIAKARMKEEMDRPGHLEDLRCNRKSR